MDRKALIYPTQIDELLSPMSVLEVWTDGGTTNNGGENPYGGWSYVALPTDGKPQIGFSEHVPGLVTNNRCEMLGVMAAIIGLAHPERKLIIKSDSQYVVKTVNEWRWGWPRKKDQSKIMNKELFEQLFFLVDNNHVDLQWVKGHSTSVGNNVADFWATRAMNKKPPTEAHIERADFVYYEGLEGFSI